MTDFTSGTGKLDALRKREAALKAAIAAETVKRKKREWKDYERVKSIVGGALLANAAQNDDLVLIVKGILKTAVIVEGDRKLLQSKGWL